MGLTIVFLVIFLPFLLIYTAILACIQKDSPRKELNTNVIWIYRKFLHLIGLPKYVLRMDKTALCCKTSPSMVIAGIVSLFPYVSLIPTIFAVYVKYVTKEHISITQPELTISFILIAILVVAFFFQLLVPDRTTKKKFMKYTSLDQQIDVFVPTKKKEIENPKDSLWDQAKQCLCTKWNKVREVIPEDVDDENPIDDLINDVDHKVAFEVDLTKVDDEKDRLECRNFDDEEILCSVLLPNGSAPPFEISFKDNFNDSSPRQIKIQFEIS